MCRLSFGRAHQPIWLLLLRQPCNLSTSQPTVRYLHIVGDSWLFGQVIMRSSYQRLDTQGMMPSMTCILGTAEVASEDMHCRNSGAGLDMGSSACGTHQRVLL